MKTRLLAAVLAALVVAGCKPAPSQIIVRIDTDMEQGPGRTLRELRVIVQSAGGAADSIVLARSYVLGVAPNLWVLPETLALTYVQGAATVQITVSPSGVAGADGVVQPLFDHVSVVTFPRDRAGQLDVFLADRCRIPENRRCEPGFTCGRAGCEAIFRGELALPRDGGPVSDASFPPPDARSPDETRTEVGAERTLDDATLDSATVDDTQSEPASEDGTLSTDAALELPSPPDAAFLPDASGPMDAVIDVQFDARVDAGSDVLVDAPTEVVADAGVDRAAPPEVGSEPGSEPPDAPVDTSRDVQEEDVVDEETSPLLDSATGIDAPLNCADGTTCMVSGLVEQCAHAGELCALADSVCSEFRTVCVSDGLGVCLRVPVQTPGSPCTDYTTSLRGRCTALGVCE